MRGSENRGAGALLLFMAGSFIHVSPDGQGKILVAGTETTHSYRTTYGFPHSIPITDLSQLFAAQQVLRRELKLRTVRMTSYGTEPRQLWSCTVTSWRQLKRGLLKGRCSKW